MIRDARPTDADAVTALAVSSGLFADDDTAVPQRMMADYFAGNREAGHRCLLDMDGVAVGVAYCAPAPATDGTWYLTMIAVQPEYQGAGRGAALMAHIETELRAAGQRLLLVETSGTPEFERTRAFYLHCGYVQEARIRDYYEAGHDMVLFAKSLKG